VFSAVRFACSRPTRACFRRIDLAKLCGLCVRSIAAGIYRKCIGGAVGKTSVSNATYCTALSGYVFARPDIPYVKQAHFHLIV
jgi:hypothetical protein